MTRGIGSPLALELGMRMLTFSTLVVWPQQQRRHLGNLTGLAE